MRQNPSNEAFEECQSFRDLEVIAEFEKCAHFAFCLVIVLGCLTDAIVAHPTRESKTTNDEYILPSENNRQKIHLVE